MNNLALIALSVAGHEVSRCDGDIRAKLLVAMRSTRASDFCHHEPDQFKAAVGAVMQHYGVGSPEWRRLEEELKVLAVLSVVIESAHLEIECTIPTIETQPEPLGLLALWMIAKGEQS